VEPRETPPRDPDKMSILEHLEELRTRILKAGVAIVVCVGVTWAFSDRIYSFLVIPAQKALPEGVKLAYTGIADPFILYMKVALLSAAFLASPFVFTQFWLFVSPGLYRNEKKWVIPFVLATTFFFVLGGGFAYKSILPFACEYFIGVGNSAGFQPVITVKELLSFELQLIMGTAIVFEMPILVFFLTRIGILTPAFLWHYFPHAMVVLWLGAAWLTPPDVFSMILVGVPMTGLYLFSIGVSWVFQPESTRPPKRKKKKPADGGAIRKSTDEDPGEKE